MVKTVTLGRVLVVYEPEPDCIVSASRYSSPLALYVRSYHVNVREVVERGDFDRAILVNCDKSRRVEEIKEMISSHGISIEEVNPERLPFSKYLIKHLLEPRIKGIKSDKYPSLIEKEYRTITIMKNIGDTHIPTSVNNILVLVTKKRVPSVDMALFISAKYKKPTCVGSSRDTGLTWACIGPTDVISSIEGEITTSIYKRVSDNIITGFFVTYPESPLVYQSRLEEMLSKIQGPTDPWVPRDVKTNYITKLLLKERISFFDFLVTHAKLKRKFLKKVVSGGTEIYVIDSMSSSPFHTIMTSGDMLSMVFYLPPPPRLAIKLPFKPTEVYVGSKKIEIDGITGPDGSYIMMMNGATKLISNEIKNNRKVVIVASR